MKLKWPRCGFRFFKKESPDWAVKPYIWRRCTKPWGHFLLPGGMPHEGDPE